MPSASRTSRPLAILIVICRYPPFHLGGYELRCRDIARRLARRGHRVTVLTSKDGRQGVEDDEGVRVVRALHRSDADPVGRGEVLRFVRTTGDDCHVFEREAADMGADVVHYWHQSGLTSALLAARRPQGCGVLCDVSSVWMYGIVRNGGNWFRIWEPPAGSGLKNAIKNVLRPLVGRIYGVPVERPSSWPQNSPPGRCYFTSNDLKQRYVDDGAPVADATVIDSGVDLELFVRAPACEYEGGAGDGAPDITVLFLSRIKRWKSLHTLVRAIARLPARFRILAIGVVHEHDYMDEVRALVKELGVADRFEYREQIPHAEIPGVIARGHVLYFGSEEPEPFSRMVLEAFAIGTPVVGTTLGGTGEVLREGETGLTFEPRDDEGLARQLRRVAEDAELRERIVEAAYELVVTRYSIDVTVRQIEEMLEAATDAAG